jgi:hypothetical protein
MMRFMSKLLKRLLRAKDNKELPNHSEPSDVDSPSESIQTENRNPTQTPKNPQKSIGTVCPNDKCGRTISKRLKVIDQSKEENYYACPYCMSRLDAMTVEQKDSSKQAPIEKPAQPKKVDSKKTESPENCPYYLGYLKERPEDTAIQNGCLTCPEAIKCLLG